ncbi:hypothetical protein H8959_022823, partial [Pygathrix nigripes]
PGEDTPRVPEKSEDSHDLENTPGPDVEMNSQVDKVNDPTESQQEDQLIGKMPLVVRFSIDRPAIRTICK